MDALGQKVSRIVGVPSVDFESDGAPLLLENFAVILETSILRVVPIPDTDEIHFEFTGIESQTGDSTLVEIERCRGFVNSTFSELWKGKNSRGYDDQLVLGFKNLHPSILILCEGSVLKLFSVSHL